MHWRICGATRLGLRYNGASCEKWSLPTGLGTGLTTEDENDDEYENDYTANRER